MKSSGPPWRGWEGWGVGRGCPGLQLSDTVTLARTDTGCSVQCPQLPLPCPGGGHLVSRVSRENHEVFALTLVEN